MHPFHIEQLKRDHEEVKQILSQMVESSKKSRKTELKKRLEKSLVPHMRAEEAVFYPALRQNRKSRDQALEAIAEHHAAELLLKELLDLRPESEVWNAKCKVFQEIVEHHIEEEEEQVFKLSREVISDEEIGKMLTNFAEEKIWYASRIRYRVVIFQMSGVRMPAALPAFLTVFHGAVSCLFSVTLFQVSIVASFIVKRSLL